MADPLRHFPSLEMIGQVDHTTGAGGDNDIRLRRLHTLQLFIGDFLGQVVMINAEGTSHAAAAVGGGHLDIFQPLEGLKNLARLVPDVLVANQVAGVVPGDGFACKFFSQLQFTRGDVQNIHEKFRDVLDLL